MSVDTEAKRWGMLQAASGPMTPVLLNPDGSDLDNEIERLSLLNLYGGISFDAITTTASPSGDAVNSVQTLINGTGATLVITLTNDTWIAAGTGPIGTLAESDAIVNGITSAQVEAGGWNAQVRDVLDNAALTRTSPTEATLTIPATGGYVITADEIITATIPNAVLTVETGDVVATAFKILSEAIVGGGGGPFSSPFGGAFGGAFGASLEEQ